MVFGKDPKTGKDIRTITGIVEEKETESVDAGQEDSNKIDTPVAFPEIPSNNASLASSSSGSKTSDSDHNERLVEVFKEVIANMDRGFKTAIENFRSCIDGREADMAAKRARFYSELEKVEGLTEEERWLAHSKISTDDRLLVVFPAIPDDMKVSWIQLLIR